MKLTTQDISNYMSSSDYSRGLSYFRKSSVIKCLVTLDSDEKLLMNGVVKGSLNNKYSQFIIINKKKHLTIISGNCSCPVGYNCKHVVAVCLEYIENGKMKLQHTIPKEIQEDLLKSWLGSLKESKEETNHKRLEESSTYFITYRLFSRDSDNSELKFYKSKYLKSGGLGKGTQLDSYKFVDSYHFKDLKNEVDNEIAELAKHLDFSRWGTTKQKFKGAFGAVLLQEILKTKRCYYDEYKEPLKFSEDSFKPELDFKLYKGEYSLKSNVDKNYKLLDTTPPYILDIDANTIYEFDMDISLFKKLKKAPKIAKKDIGKVYQAIGNRVPNIEIKTPRGMKITTIDSEPIPQI